MPMTKNGIICEGFQLDDTSGILCNIQLDPELNVFSTLRVQREDVDWTSLDSKNNTSVIH